MMTRNANYKDSNSTDSKPLLYKHGFYPQNFLENTYSSDKVPAYELTLLWISKGYGIFHLRFDKIYNEAVVYLIPLFLYVSFDDDKKNDLRYDVNEFI